jgi:hypothetical protein
MSSNMTHIYSKQSDRSRGFGFIKMATVEDATRCIQELNGVVSSPPDYSYLRSLTSPQRISMDIAFVWITPSLTAPMLRPQANTWAIVDQPAVIHTLTEVDAILTVTPIVIPTVATLIAVAGVVVTIATEIIMVATTGIGAIAAVQLLPVVDVIPLTTGGGEVILGALLEAVALLVAVEIMMHLLRLAAPLRHQQVQLILPDGEVVACSHINFPLRGSLALVSCRQRRARRVSKISQVMKSSFRLVVVASNTSFQVFQSCLSNFVIRIPVDSTQNPSCQVSCPFFCYLACIRRRCFLQLSLLFASARINSSLDIHGRFTCQ